MRPDPFSLEQGPNEYSRMEERVGVGCKRLGVHSIVWEK